MQQSEPSLVTCSTLLLLLLAVLLPSCARGQQQQEQPAYLIESLAASNPSNHSYATLHELLQPASLAQYNRIELLEDYHLKPALYNDQAPLRLAGNVTISSANYASHGYRVLYTEFKESSVLIPSGIRVVFRDIALGRARKTSGQGIPLFVGEGERSLLLLDNVVRIRTSCAPQPSQLVASLNSAAAAAAAASTGNSSAGGGGGSSNSSGPIAASLEDFTFRGRVFPDSLHAINVSSMVTPGDVSDLTTYYSGYSILQLNTTRVCLSYVDPACVAAQGADACIMAAINLGLAEEAAAAAQQPAGPHVPVAAIAVPSAVGGFLLLSVAALGLFLLSRQRRLQQQQQPKSRQHDEQLLPRTGTGGSSQAALRQQSHHHHHHHHSRSDGAVIIGSGTAGAGELSGSFDGSADEGDGGGEDTHHSDPSNIPGSVVSGAVGTIEKLALSNRGSGWMLVACHTSPEFSDATPKDRIKLGVLLGAGSGGRVYKGSWRRMTVAVKVLTHDSTTAAAISNEVDLVMSFRHPNIVAAYHFATWRQVGRQSASDQQLLPASRQQQDQQQEQQQQQQQQAHKGRAGLTTATECTFGSSLPSSSVTSRPSLDLAAGPRARLGGAGAAAWGADPRASERFGTGGSSNSSSSNVSAVLSLATAAPGIAAGAAAAAAVPPDTPRAAAAGGKGGDHVALSIVPFSPQQQQECRSSSRLFPCPPSAAARAAADPAVASPFAAAAVLQPFGSSGFGPGGGARALGAAASSAGAAPPSTSLGAGSTSSLRSSAGAAATAAAMQKLLSAHTRASKAAAGTGTAPSATSQPSSHPQDISGSHSTSPGGTGKLGQPGPLPQLQKQQADDSSATIQFIPFTPAQLNEALDRERRSSLSAGSASLSAPLPERFDFEEHASDTIVAAAAAAATTSGAGAGAAGGSSGAAGGSAAGASSALGGSAAGSSTSSALMTGRPRLATLRQQGDPFESQTWLILEYCDGGTLLDLLLEGRLAAPGSKPGVPAHILTLLLDICSGMAYLHARNVLHGDLKPGNVLIKAQAGAPYGRVAKVADFGLSRALQVGQTHRSTRTMGTMNHAPPELLRLGRLSPSGDVYAFGVLMWECFSGQMAFSGLHYGELFEQVALHQLRPPVPEGMPADYAALMAECWAADPFARPGFASVQARLSAMLEPLAQAEGHLSHVSDL